ncbi:C6 zinc finger domain protein [Penicillium angulare]|uniref:C6 zinc finger domain protein n=1 Tax=Penicillium angulare TaxID=116970 RepID=UPI0025416A16|nr:C6 zinc finger domain protein [Penicillium angulare]KAJ5281714.1 C6 zinc finger domain protein [Penicillium angulare]
MQHRARLDMASYRPTAEFGADRTLIIVPGSRQERQFLHTFYEQGAGCVGGYVPSDLWDRLIPQLVQNRPMIRHAVAAVSATCLQQFCPQLEAKERNGMVALRQYNKAIKDFLEFTATAEASEFEHVLVACVLFTCLEMVKGDRGRAVNHLEGALRLLHKYQARVGDRIIKTAVAQLLIRLNSQLPFLGRPLIPLPEPKHQPGEAMHFNTIEEAREMVTRMQRRVTDFNTSISTDEKGDLIGAELQKEYAMILQMYDQWEPAFHRLIVDSAKKAKPLDPRSLLIVDIAFHTCAVYTKAAASLTETAYDAHMYHWEGIVNGAEQILLLGMNENVTHSPLSNLFSMEAEVIPMAWWAAARCRDPFIQRRAISVLSRHSRTEGFWNAKVLLRVVERVLEYEEAPLVSLPIGQRIPAEHQRVCLAYAAPKDGVFSNPVPVFMMTKPDGVDKAPKIWWEYLEWETMEVI